MTGRGLGGLAFLSFSVLFIFIVPLAQALADNQNLAMGPGSVRCISAYIPDDWGEIAGKTIFTITSDCAWCDLSTARVTTDQDNPVIFPVCIITPWEKVNKSISFRVGLEALGKKLEFNYGVCVSDQEDLDSGGGDPCGVLDSRQDIFDFGIEPDRLYANPGEAVSYTLFLQSQAGLSLELTSMYGGKKGVELSAGEPHQVEFGLSAPSQKGEYDVEIKAEILNCNFPSCSRSVSAELIVGKEKPSSGNFSMTLFPENYNTEQLDTIIYTLRIRNMEEAKAYNARLFLPEGLETDFTPRTLMISETQDLRFNITPRERKLYEITAEAETSNAKKQAKAYLTVGEMEGDLERMKEDLSADAKGKIDRWIENYGDASYQDKMDSFGTLLSDVSQQKPVNWTQGPGKPEPQGLDPLIIAIPVAAVIAVLLFYFYKSRRAEEEEYGYERY